MVYIGPKNIKFEKSCHCKNQTQKKHDFVSCVYCLNVIKVCRIFFHSCKYVWKRHNGGKDFLVGAQNPRKLSPSGRISCYSGFNFIFESMLVEKI